MESGSDARGWRLECSLLEMGPVRFEVVGDPQSWQPWKQLVGRYHYLGVKKPTGRRVHYLVYAGQEPIGELGWKGGSLQLRARDCSIGWDASQRRTFLDHVINNYRFVLVDWLHVPNLASHVLGRCARLVCRDWRERHGVAPWLLETFVDPRRCAGTSYRAAGWQASGGAAATGSAAVSMPITGNRRRC